MAFSVGSRVAVNILTVDVEDWQQSTLDHNLPISERALRNTHRLLDILAEFVVHGTFFVQTLVAQRYPDLVRRVAAEGHEIASHGHSHVPLFKLRPADFAEDLRCSLEILQKLSPYPVRGYRAPDFSIRHDTLWALDILREQGIRYSSSIYPFAGHRYGMLGTGLQPHQIIDGLVEVPLSVVRLAGRNWPVAGGGYLRLLPYWTTRWAIRRINAEGRAAVVYVHPYELDEQEMQRFRGRIPWRLYLSQSLNRHQTESKLRSLLRDFGFAPVREVIAV
jgi:polysaccharide deacetylase family protein (PEP-CTERM system associated)